VSQWQLALLFSLLAVAALALAGRRPYAEEFAGRPRQTVAALLLIGILAVSVFLPLTSFGKVDELEFSTVWVPALLVGHLLIATFLFGWWRLRGDVPLHRFLYVSWTGLPRKLVQGIAVGFAGWGLTVLVAGATAAIVGTATEPVAGPEVPPVMVWLASLPALDKLLIVGAAMTVEEFFFRSFLQPRVGLLVSSLFFVCSHFGYGLPVMLVGVLTISLLLGLTFQRGGDVVPCVVAHGVFDAVQLFIVLPWAVERFQAGALG
jgi:membrane protease YdiL (CAAX protease family)